MDDRRRSIYVDLLVHMRLKLIGQNRPMFRPFLYRIASNG